MSLTNAKYTLTGFTAISPAIGNGAKTCGTIRDFVVIGNGYDIQWSAIGDATDFPTPATDDARSKQSGRQSMINKFGIVTGIVGGDFFGYVFQERAITKQTYVGGDVVFTFDTFEEGRGSFELNRYETVDDKVFFQSKYGYHLLEQGIITNIGIGKVDRTHPPV